MTGEFAARYWLELTLIDGVGDATIRRLLRAFGSPRDALRASFAGLKEAGLSADASRRVKGGADKKRVASALKWAEGDGNHLISIADDGEYPPRLLAIDSPPTLLYLRGRPELLLAPSLAVVGSRSASAAGARNARIISRALAQAGVCVISGLAQGIDAAAHQGALAGGATVAALGTGVDMVYPKEHRKLAAEIAERGALLSEFALGAGPLGAHFPRRNRIISGIAMGCLVAEATLKSGALITAGYARDENRDVFAIPGSINSPLYRGCHKLIKEGARLVENVEDVLQEFSIAAAPPPAAVDDAPGQQPNASGFIEFVEYAPTDVETLCAKSGLGADAVLANLLELELQSRVESLPGGMYQRLR
jgi:DNA processing protein